MQTIIAVGEGCQPPLVAVTQAEIERFPEGAGDQDNALIGAMVGSEMFRAYERSFAEAIGLPVSLTPVETWQLPHHGHRGENPFCGLLAHKSRACAVCLQTQKELCRRAADEPCSVTCPAGFTDTAVPVRMGDKRIGFLHTGQIFRQTPSESQFENTLRLAREWGLDAKRNTLHQLYFSTRVMPARQHASVVKLLTIFAEHLSMISNQIYMEQHHSENPAIARARAYIQEHHSRELTLRQVAGSVGASPFYFCKLFKKSTGINFTEYVSRVRVERAKHLLLNPNLHVSEIAFEVGFQSLPHFNRMFKKILGQSPTAYRLQLLGG
jgi:AraC-like DNA-binding protein